MKRIKLLYFVLLCVLVSIMVSISNVFASVANSIDTIYYFTDYYSTVKISNLKDKFPNKTVTLDHQYIDISTFDSMVNNNYFSNFNSTTCVVIDIKTFKPNDTTLYNLYTDLKNNQNAYTVFVSPYKIDSYSNDSFIDYVDKYFTDSQFERLTKFVNGALDHYFDNYQVDNSTYLIDSDLLNIDEIMGLKDLYFEKSPFVELFLQKLADMNELSYQSFDELLSKLELKKIKILAYSKISSNYKDLISENVYQFNSISSLLSTTNASNICAFGFWNLSKDFYYKLLTLTTNSNFNLPIYVMEVEELKNGPGLSVISDTMLGCDFDLMQDEIVEWIGVDD